MRISCAVRAVIKLYCTNVSCEWVSCLLFQCIAAHDVLMPVFFHCDTSYCFFWRCLSVHNIRHLHVVKVHHNCGSSWLILTFGFCDVVMGASSAHRAVRAPISEWHVCWISPSLLRRFVWFCYHTQVGRCGAISPLTPSSSDRPSSPSPTLFHFVP